MAIYHCSVKTISRSQGRSATGAAAYRSGEKITDERSGIVHDYTRKGNIDHTEILAPENSPSWVHDRSTLWNEVELCEKRKDARVCREIEVALPVELTPDESRDLVRGFIQDEFVKKGMVADLAIHHANDENPHAHILLTTREISPDGFGGKERGWDKKECLQSWRESWETHANNALEVAGHEERIDHRTLEAQGIDRIPQIHVGAKVTEMEQRGIRTERGQAFLDIASANEKIISLQKYKESIEHEYTLETEKRKDNARACERDRATSSSAGDTERSDHSSARSTAASEPDALRELDKSADRDGTSLDTGSEGLERARTGAQTSDTRCSERTQAPVDPLGPDGLHGRDAAYDTALDRILALVSTTPHNEQGRQAMDDRTTGNIDRTYLAVQRQLKALNCDSYDIGIKNKDGKMMTRCWSADETLKSVNWLKRENAKGAEIYIRPSGEKNQGIILVDDLNQSQIKAMKAKGYEPAVVVETSPQNHQAWVRLSDRPLDPGLATGISKAMSNHFGGDPNSADWRHFGRLAGFTNQKPEHKNAQGRSPWVLCHESNGKKSSQGENTVHTISQRMEEAQREKVQQTRIKQAVEASHSTSKRDPIRMYQNQFKTLRERYGADMDLSRADYMICSNMAKLGFGKDQLVKTLEHASPELVTRKASHENDYCKRTVDAAFASSQVQDHLQQVQANTKSRGFSR